MNLKSLTKSCLENLRSSRQCFGIKISSYFSLNQVLLTKLRVKSQKNTQPCLVISSEFFDSLNHLLDQFFTVNM